MGLFGSKGREQVSNMRRGALLHRRRLSEPSILTTNKIKSLMYILFVPLASMSMSTISSRPSPKGMLMSRLLAGGTRCWFLLKSVVGSHSLLCKIAVVRSHMIFDMQHQKLGQGYSPKVRQRFMKPIFRSGIWVTVLEAISQ
jgi:hypothetical protein